MTWKTALGQYFDIDKINFDYDGITSFSGTLTSASPFCDDFAWNDGECPIRCNNISWEAITEQKFNLPKINRVIFNDPATIVFWDDGVKTVVKASNEKFDPEKGIALAYMKRMLGNTGKYFDTVRKFAKAYEEANEE